MAINHSAGSRPPYIQREDASSSTTAFIALEVTPPAWAQTVDIVNDGGDMRVAATGTDGSALSADYVTVADGEGYRLQLQGEDQVGDAAVFYVAGADSTVDLAFVYRALE